MKYNVLFYVLILMVGTMLWLGCGGKDSHRRGYGKSRKSSPPRNYGTNHGD